MKDKFEKHLELWIEHDLREADYNKFEFKGYIYWIRANTQKAVLNDYRDYFKSSRRLKQEKEKENKE